MASRRNRTKLSGSPKISTQATRKIQNVEALALRGSPTAVATHAPYALTVQDDLTVLGSTTITTTTGALVVPRLTTTQRNALTAAVGMIIYNTSDSKFQGYAGSTWVNLH